MRVQQFGQSQAGEREAESRNGVKGIHECHLLNATIPTKPTVMGSKSVLRTKKLILCEDRPVFVKGPSMYERYCRMYKKKCKGKRSKVG